MRALRGRSDAQRPLDRRLAQELLLEMATVETLSSGMLSLLMQVGVPTLVEMYRQRAGCSRRWR